VAEFFEGALAEGASVKNAANLIVGTIFSNMDTEEEKELFDIRISSAQFAALVKLADEKKLTSELPRALCKNAGERQTGGGVY